MIALKDIISKDFKILTGEKIPANILKVIDVDRLKEMKIIKDEKQENHQYNSNKKGNK